MPTASILPVSAAMLLVMALGALARRLGWLSGESTAGLSRLTIDAAFPSLVLAQLVRTVSPAQLAARWYLPLVGALVIVAGQLVGLALAPLFVPRERAVERRTFVFLVAIANWIFLPLPIARRLAGDDGVQVVLLLNVGVQPILWTLGVGTLRGGGLSLRSLGQALLNPGMIATALGLVVAVTAPGWARGDSVIAQALFSALQIAGDLTVPMSLVITGSHLAASPLSSHRPTRALGGVVLGRLLLTPALIVLGLALAARSGHAMPHVPEVITSITAAMPTAVSCALFAERYGGDVTLATRGIFYTTVLGLFTVTALAMALG